MPLHLAYFFNCCAIGKVTTCIYGNLGEAEEPIGEYVMTTGSNNAVNRRTMLRQTGAAAAAGAAGCTADSAGTGEQPNILFIFSDQQRWDAVNCYGSPLVENLTPNLDAMAAEGIRFENAFTCQPVCGPARSCLQTGKYATETGCYRNAIALPTDETTIAHRLSGAGYEVGYIGKWHLATTREQFNHETGVIPPEHRGGYKDFWLASDILEFTSHGYGGYMHDGDGNRREWGEDRYRADALTDWTLDYLRTRKGDRPFFLFLSYVEPHHQNDRQHFEGPHGSDKRFQYYRIPDDLTGTQGDWRPEMADYLGCCHAVDANVGRIRAELETLGLADNTVVIYTTDHGCHFRTRNSEYKRTCHDNAVRVPMIIRGPGFLGGRVVDNMASLIDLPPTVLHAGGVDVPDSMRGRPLQQAVDGGGTDWPDDVFIQISESHVGRAVRTKNWKYAVRAPGKSGGRDPDAVEYEEAYLYNLKTDPHERTNLVRDPETAKVRADLRDRLLRHMTAIGEPTPVISPLI
jgi:arylsulfatase A-like enzyme